jgi:phosphoribosylformylglycinamidine cyclo-ligase
VTIERRAEEEAPTYRAAGVDVEAGEEAVRLIKKDVESTYIPGVLSSLGGFAGLFELPKGLEDPVLVSGTDGVGTKILLAQETKRLSTVGIDLVAMSVNDVLFLDYVAVGMLQPGEMAQLVSGVAEGCRQAGCALIGGEMAEMSGLYAPGEFDLAGFCVALADRKKLVVGSSIKAGDVVVGLASSGVHSNGYSLVRLILEKSGVGLSDVLPGTTGSAGEVLLTPTRIYVKSVLGLLEQGVPIEGMAHITGGGIAGNLSRVIPEGLSAHLHLDRWPVPPVFQALETLGDVSQAEMYLAFNMGLGFVVGEITAGADRVVLEGLE